MNTGLQLGQAEAVRAVLDLRNHALLHDRRVKLF